MALMAEVEIGALYSHTRKGKELHLALTKMGHPQPPSPVLTDNSTACGIINTTVHNRCAQGHLLVYWVPGKDNLADYHTKRHSTA
eukprot:1930190-Ditylum_brightwellii.AAC.1